MNFSADHHYVCVCVCMCVCIYICIYISIIKSHWQHRLPDSYHLSLSCKLHPVSWSKFLLLGQYSCVHMLESISECHLWVHPCFSSRFQHGLFVLFWLVFEMGGKWPYNYCFVGCCFQNLFKIASSILV